MFYENLKDEKCENLEDENYSIEIKNLYWMNLVLMHVQMAMVLILVSIYYIFSEFMLCALYTYLMYEPTIDILNFLELIFRLCMYT